MKLAGFPPLRMELPVVKTRHSSHGKVSDLAGCIFRTRPVCTAVRQIFWDRKPHLQAGIKIPLGHAGYGGQNQHFQKEYPVKL